jgi:hypothetical protein
MLSSSMVSGILIGFVVGILTFSAWSFGNRRKDMGRRLSAMDIMAMAEKLGIDLDVGDIGKTREGDRLLSAMVFCEDCASLESCHNFLQDPAAKAEDLSTFCPNAIYLHGLAARQKKAA